MEKNINEAKKTRIIATLGPACNEPKNLKSILEAGADMIRLNASHQADPKIILNQINLIRQTAKKCKKAVGIFLDLQGPKIRIGKFAKDKVTIETGAKFILTAKNEPGDETKVSLSYPGLVQDVQVGDPIFIDDGKFRLIVEKKQTDKLICKVIQGGVLSNNKGINVPNTHIRLSALTPKDKLDAQLAVNTKLDYIALSFVSTAADISELRELINSYGAHDLRIIAKIERQKALDNIAEILTTADGIMVARGDLGVEIGIENVPKAQKMLIKEANRNIKPVIVATQMLESMITAKMATRAEVSDVANAIYDRCDAVMLSGETAVGIDPVNAVTTMHNICLATDLHMEDIKKNYRPIKNIFNQCSTSTSLCIAADRIAEENGAKAIITFTSSGATALITSKLNSIIPIIAPTDSIEIYQKMALYRGVVPLLIPKKFEDITKWTNMISMALNEGKKHNLFKTGDRLVMLAGIPFGRAGGTNSIRVITV